MKTESKVPLQAIVNEQRQIMVNMKRQSEDVGNQLSPPEHIITDKIEIPSQSKASVLGDTGVRTKLSGVGSNPTLGQDFQSRSSDGDILQEQSAKFMKSIQTRMYKEENDAPNCRRLSALDFLGEEMKGEALLDKMVGLGTLFAIDSNFLVELLSNIWKTQHEELNSSQLYKSACPFIVGKDCKCEIDRLNSVLCLTDVEDGITPKMIGKGFVKIIHACIYGHEKPISTDKIEIPSQSKASVLGDTGVRTKLSGVGSNPTLGQDFQSRSSDGDILQEQSAKFMKSIQTRMYKEENDAPNCRRLSALDFLGEEMKGEALLDKMVGLGTLFAIDSNFLVELLSNIWKTQHEELNSSQLYKSACPFIVGKDCKCEIDRLNSVLCLTDVKDGITPKMIGKGFVKIIHACIYGHEKPISTDINEVLDVQDPYSFRLLLMDSFHGNYDSCGDKGSSTDVDNFGRDTVQGSHIETTFNIRNCTKANKYTSKSILNLEAAGVIASHVCNMLINNYLNYKFVVLNKLDYCSSLKNSNPLRSSPNFKFIKGGIASDDMVHFILQAEFIHTILHFAAQTHVDHYFGNSFLITIRENKAFGTSQFSGKLILKFIPLMLKGKSLSIYENESNVRSYLYSEDVAEAFEVILQRGEVDHGHNIGNTICKKIMGGYVSNPEWWGVVPSALLSHLWMLMVLERERQFNVTNSSNLDSTHMKNKFSESGIAGLLGELCDKQNIPLENENGCLEQCSQFLVDVQTEKSIYVVSTTCVNGRSQVDWCETYKYKTRTNVVGTLTLVDVCKECHPLMTNYVIGATHPLGNGVGFEKEDKLNFTSSFYYKIKAMVKEVLREPDNVCTLKVQISILPDFSNPRNFITKISRSNQVVDVPNNLTILDELLPVSIEMATGNLEDKVLFPGDGIVMNVRHRQLLNTAEVDRGTRESQPLV
ncbi:hypothetical protein GQ457_09G024390 [Hibiscus cannabinus]